MESAAINKCNHKKSLFTCFKPNDEDYSFKQARKRQKVDAEPEPDPVLNYLSSADEDGVVVYSSSVGEAREEESCTGNRQRKKGRGTWHSLRKTLNDTTLVKKIIRRWKTRKENISRSNSHMETKTIGKQNTTHKTNSNSSSTLGGNSSSIIFTPSSSSSLSSTSSLSSHGDHVSGGSSSNEINSPPLNGTSSRQNSTFKDRRKMKCGSNNAMCIASCMLSMISLLVLILWGKFFAILCTSISFYVLPLSRKRQYKGEVMEGMLERKHSHVSLASISKS